MTHKLREVLKRYIVEEFKDRLPECHQRCEMIMQMKDEEWNQFVKVRDQRVQDRAVLQVFVEV